MENYEAVLLDLKSRKVQLIESIKEIDIAIVAIETIIKQKNAIALSERSFNFNSKNFFSKMSLSDAIRHCLSVNERPLSAKEISIMLIKGGIVHVSENFPQSVTATLHRLEKERKEVRRLERGLWVINKN